MLLDDSEAKGSSFAGSNRISSGDPGSAKVGSCPRRVWTEASSCPFSPRWSSLRAESSAATGGRVRSIRVALTGSKRKPLGFPTWRYPGDAADTDAHTAQNRPASPTATQVRLRISVRRFTAGFGAARLRLVDCGQALCALYRRAREAVEEKYGGQKPFKCSSGCDCRRYSSRIRIAYEFSVSC